MTNLTAPSQDVQAARALAEAEERLRVLHALIPEARLQQGFEAHYAAFVRALRERLHPRGVRDVRTVEVAGGHTFRLDVGDRLGCDVFYGYYDERFEASVLASSLDAGATMLDVGANFGYYAVLCGAAVGPSGAVHAVEPDPAAFELLTANAAANGLAGWLHGHAAAVGAQDGTVEFHLAEEAAFSGLSPTGRSGTRGVIQVPLRSLDAFADEAGISQIDALKVDVEGHERDVLAGARRLLQRSPDPLLLLEVTAKNLAGEDRAALAAEFAFLYEHGYHGLLPDLSANDGLRTVSSADEAAGLSSANLFLVRAGGERERRLRAAVIERLDTAPTFEARHIDADDRAIRLYQGLDPDLVAAALRDRAEAEGRAHALADEVAELRIEIERLVASRDAARATVRRLRVTPLGLVNLAARRVARAFRRPSPPSPARGRGEPGG